MRALLAVASLTALAAGCGSSTSGSERGAPSPGSLEALWKQSGQQVALIPGTNDYAPGDLRISFLVVDDRGRLVATTARPVLDRALARRQAVPANRCASRAGRRGRRLDGRGRAVSLRRARARERAGNVLRAGSADRASRDRRRCANVVVRKHAASPAVGSRAYPSKTPTLASAHGRAAKITTPRSPDRGLLHYSVAESLRAHVPFVVTFATPALLLEPYLRPGRRRRRSDAASPWQGRVDPFHPRRDLPGQQSAKRREPLGAGVAPAVGAVDVPRRP